QGRQLLRQPQPDRRRRRRAAIRRPEPLRHRPQGRRPALPATLRHREDDNDQHHRGGRQRQPAHAGRLTEHAGVARPLHRRCGPMALPHAWSAAMAKVLVLYYSAYGHIEKMAEAVAMGARDAGAEVDIRRVPELVPDEVAQKSGYKLDQDAPIAKVDELPNYDAIVIGVGTRYGRMASQMANFLDQTGGLWASGALVGKVGSAFSSTATQHGGQETTLMAIHTNLMHFGMACVGL